MLVEVKVTYLVLKKVDEKDMTKVDTRVVLTDASWVVVMAELKAMNWVAHLDGMKVVLKVDCWAVDLVYAKVEVMASDSAVKMVDMKEISMAGY